MVDAKKRQKESTWTAKDLSWIMAALTPWARVPDPPPKKAGGKTEPFGTEVAREGIKLPSKQCDVVTGAFRNCCEITKVKDAISNGEPWVSERDKLGMTIRKWGPSWKLHALFALLVEAMNHPPALDAQLVKAMSFPPTFCDVRLLEGWQGFVDHVEKMDLMKVATEPLPLSGKVLLAALGNIKPGKWTANALNICMEWKLRNPDSTNIEEAIEEVKKRRVELGIPPA
jgi:hypothetical protein